MYLVKAKARRDDTVPVWNVGNTARVIGVEAAVDLAFDVHAEQMRNAPVRTLWTAYSRDGVRS